MRFLFQLWKFNLPKELLIQFLKVCSLYIHHCDIVSQGYCAGIVPDINIYSTVNYMFSLFTYTVFFNMKILLQHKSMDAMHTVYTACELILSCIYVYFGISTLRATVPNYLYMYTYLANKADSDSV